MFSRNPGVIFVADLRDADIPNSHWFEENSPRGLAGRCLLDALEYLHSSPKFPARFWHVVNAHAVRLVHRCLMDQDVNRKDVLDRMARHIEDTCQQLLNSRQTSIPYFGDDFWDWASVINAFNEVKDVSPSAKQALHDELGELSKTVQDRMPDALSIGDPDREWFGPATAALTYRVLDKLLADGAPGRAKLLKDLKTQALQKIEGGKYLDHDVPKRHELWHYGQVVAVFEDEAKEQAAQLADFSWLRDPLEKSERVYTLARVLQGAYAADDKKTIKEALERLYQYQSLGRPLGQGLMGDTVKGSLNVLDALWPKLTQKERAAIGSMVDALIHQYAKANTIGFQVAIAFEADTLASKLAEIGATVGPEIDGARMVKHRKFRAVIRQGKSNSGATSATTALIDTHKAKWIIMTGIAGSLGTARSKADGSSEFVGPIEGEVIVATSFSPFRLRDKTREIVATAAFPFGGSTWMIIPADPHLFRLAHLASEQSPGEFRGYREGQIVTGTGILDSKDNPHKGKEEVLKEFAGSLAIEEEGYQMGIVCLTRDIPCLNIRGISDLAEGGKRVQGDDKAKEAWEQKGAGRAAASLAVKVALLLSDEW